MRREEKKQEAEKTKKAKGRKGMLVWVVAMVLAVGAGFGIFRYFISGADNTAGGLDVTKICVNHVGSGMHIHTDLRIGINESRQEIPANIGVSANCMRPLHTHDNTGKIHVEFPRQHNFTLGEFFKVWDKPFPGEISITVNGEPNTEYENLILRDQDRIEIKYAK